MQRAETAARCLNDETLAAYVDGGLSARERSQVEAHLAQCRECVALLAESAKTLRAIDEAEAPASRRPLLRWASPWTWWSRPRSRARR